MGLLFSLAQQRRELTNFVVEFDENLAEEAKDGDWKMTGRPGNTNTTTPITLATVWLLGEFGEMLIQGRLVDEETPEPIQDSDLVDLAIEDSMLQSPYANTLIRQFVLTPLSKLSSRAALSDPQKTRIFNIPNGFATSTELEIQQCAVEFASLLSHADIRAGVLEVMPPPEIKATVIGTVSERRYVGSTRTDKDSLLDLMGDEPAAAPAAAAAPAQSNNDILADLFGGGSAPAAAAAAPAAQPKNTIQDILGLFDAAPASTPPPAPVPAANGANPMAGLFDSTPAPAAAPSPAPVPTPAQAPRPAAPPASGRPTFVAYEKNGLRIMLVPQVLAARPGMVQIQARFEALSGPLQGISFQVAVPRTQQLQMLPMSNADVQPGAVETQVLKILAPPGSQVKLRIRVGFTGSAGPVQDQLDFAGFPASMTNGVM